MVSYELCLVNFVLCLIYIPWFFVGSSGDLRLSDNVIG